VFRAHISIGNFTSLAGGYRALRKIDLPVRLHGADKRNRLQSSRAKFQGGPRCGPPSTAPAAFQAPCRRSQPPTPPTCHSVCDAARPKHERCWLLISTIRKPKVERLQSGRGSPIASRALAVPRLRRIARRGRPCRISRRGRWIVGSAAVGSSLSWRYVHLDAATNGLARPVIRGGQS
jgi:hypothetical protein